MVMIIANIHEAKAKLSEYLEAASKGERVLICNRNRPVAELRPVAAAPTEPRPIGGATGFTVPPSFFEPLPDDLVDAFNSGTAPADLSRAWKVAEAPAPPCGGGSRTRGKHSR
jgi:prevent-host-death family protein